MKLIDLIKIALDSKKPMAQRIRRGGGKVGDKVDFVSSNIDLVMPSLISIGNNVTLTHVYLLVHDASTKKSLGYTKFGKVTIGDNVFIGLETVILPGVEIGSNVVIGAGSIVSHDIPSGVIAVGAPCKPVASFDDYIGQCRELIAQGDFIDKYPADLSVEEEDKVLTVLERQRYFFMK